MLDVKFYDAVDDALLEFAVIISKSNGKWVFCKHKKRNTYESPGGHREIGENILDTAKRELQEETGAVQFDIKPICFFLWSISEIGTARAHAIPKDRGKTDAHLRRFGTSITGLEINGTILKPLVWRTISNLMYGKAVIRFQTMMKGMNLFFRC